MGVANALVNLHMCADWPEPSLLAAGPPIALISLSNEPEPTKFRKLGKNADQLDHHLNGTRVF